MTPRDAWHRYLDGRRTEITEETASTYHYRLKLFVEWCEENEIETVSELTGWALNQYESARSGDGVAATTLHNEMETLESFVEYLERIEAVDDGLADRVNIPDGPADEKSRETKLETDRALSLPGDPILLPRANSRAAAIGRARIRSRPVFCAKRRFSGVVQIRATPFRAIGFECVADRLRIHQLKRDSWSRPRQ
ncbi:site-specific integrase [Halosolutus amylolyticus]|uniref:Site-specific integrase n=1 Tax=Halosolutus amylolyticus TaxID=2932267 RepID=A0ABD5PKI7_9EURY|nr:site-specific integrase [Halosolutus amylolyticus]